VLEATPSTSSLAPTIRAWDRGPADGMASHRAATDPYGLGLPRWFLAWAATNRGPYKPSGRPCMAVARGERARSSLTIMHVKRTVNIHVESRVVEVERTIGLDKARGKLGQLAEEVRAENAPVVLMRRGEPLAVLVSPAEYERLTAADRRAVAEQLQARLVEVRNAVREAGLDVAVVDEAIAAARAAE